VCWLKQFAKCNILSAFEFIIHARTHTHNTNRKSSGKLRFGQSGDRIPVGARFSVPVQTCPGGPTGPLFKGYRFSLLGVKRQERDVDHQPSRTEVKERVEL
jgi:hypothetical protein